MNKQLLLNFLSNNWCMIDGLMSDKERKKFKNGVVEELEICVREYKEKEIMYYKIKYLKDGNPQGRAYTFQSEDELAEGDIVDISEKQRGIVTSSMLEDTDKKWIETYGSDAVKTVKKHVEEGKKAITEEMKEEDKWYEEARDVTVETLPEFVRHLTEDYHHDYGTICHVLSACALAACWAANKSPCGGITGFQAGFVMWDFIRQWAYRDNKCGMRIFDYDNMLYPQYKDKFEKYINEDTFHSLQKAAQDKIVENEREIDLYNERLEKYKTELEQFKVDVVKFHEEHPEYPAFEENPAFYEHIGFGTCEELEEERKKEESGFMFAPRKPAYLGVHPAVLEHWKSIVNGQVPFGYEIKEDK